MKDSNTTIAAVSTAYGEGGIGIVRISGQEAERILSRLFVRKASVRGGEQNGVPSASGADAHEGSITEFNFVSRHMHYGYVVDPGTGETIDEALFVFMRKPHTYTGEDVAEIQCHGSVVSLRRTLDAVLRCGAEPASPGEFTQRAFLNGRIDLTQAEAVIDVIQAKTERGASVAVTQLEGGLSQKVGEARGVLADALALAVVNIDYPDDDKDFRDEDSAQSQITNHLRDAIAQVATLIATSDTGRILREGLNVVIAGAANAGKSSLLNALLKESRAIVTATPGTTRDSIEEQASIRGIPVRLTDTAGIRETDNEIEQMGIDRALTALADADLIVFLVDGSKEIDEDDVEALRLVKKENRKHIVIALSKTDLPQVTTDENIGYLLADAGLSDAIFSPVDELYTIGNNIESSAYDDNRELYTMYTPAETGDDSGLYTIRVSAETGSGIQDLEDIIERAVYGGAAPQGDEPLVTNIRHKNLLMKAAAEIESADEELVRSGNIDLAETNIRTAYDCLGEIIGETATDDILERIFSRFCIGK